MPAPALLPENNILGLGVGIAAVLLSVFSLRRTAQIADRQYALSYMQDVTKWAGEVVDEFQKVHACLRTDSHPPVDKQAILYGHTDVLRAKYHQGRFLLADPEDGMPGEAVLSIIRDYYHALDSGAGCLPAGTPIADQPFRDLREQFIARLESIVPSRVRSESAQRLIKQESENLRTADGATAITPRTRHWRWVFWSAAAVNLGVALAMMIAPAPVLALFASSAANLLIVQFGGWLVAVFGMGYALVALHPVENRGILRIAVIGKLGVFALVVAHWLAGRAPAVLVPVAATDALWSVAFLSFLSRSRPS